MAKTLVAGPWLGEFGWEIMSWQGHVRKMAQGFDSVVVSGPPGHEALYEDFCDTYLPHFIPGDKDCWKLHCDHRSKEALENELVLMAKQLNATRIKPAGYVAPDHQKLISYGNPAKVPDDRVFDILFHFRLRHDRGQERNTPSVLASGIVQRLPKNLRVACIGSKEESVCFPHFKDMRGLPLCELMDVISRAWLVTGPASGPLVLAALCSTPTISWSSKRWYSAVRMNNRERMTKGWNPFHVPCKVLDEFGFQPPAIEAANAIKEALDWARPWKNGHLRGLGVSG